MALTDTAEYWWDVKKHYPYMGREFYHILNANCGHRHLHEAKKIGDVNCFACLKLIEQVKNFGKSQVNEGMGDVKWASDGGYYTTPDRSIIVSKEDANFINNTIEEFKRNILDSETPILVDETEKGRINMEIINDLRKNWNVNFEYDNEEGTDYFWLSSNQNIQDVNDGLENAWQLFYDRIQK